MSARLRREADRVRDRLEHGDPSWPPQLAVAVAIGLNLVLADRVTIGPTWLLPAVEGALLVALVVVAPSRVTDHSHGVRRFALAVIGFVSLVNVLSLALLIHYLVDGGRADGQRLIASGAALWATNVLLFGVWYWELDRGGPAWRFAHPDAPADFQFTQMGDPATGAWRAGFGDYLYLALTNATAFSPTDTLPLTLSAKALMALQATSALATVGLVIARAVNVLG